MPIEEHHLNRLMEIYHRDYGVQMDLSQAEAEFAKLSQLYGIIYLSPTQLQIQDNESAVAIYGSTKSSYNELATHQINN